MQEDVFPVYTYALQIYGFVGRNRRRLQRRLQEMFPLRKKEVQKIPDRPEAEQEGKNGAGFIQPTSVCISQVVEGIKKEQMNHMRRQIS